MGQKCCSPLLKISRYHDVKIDQTPQGENGMGQSVAKVLVLEVPSTILVAIEWMRED